MDEWIFSIQALDLIPSSGAQRILQANGFRTCPWIRQPHATIFQVSAMNE
jgi:hypothetical protein